MNPQQRVMNSPSYFIEPIAKTSSYFMLMHLIRVKSYAIQYQVIIVIAKSVTGFYVNPYLFIKICCIFHAMFQSAVVYF